MQNIFVTQTDDQQVVEQQSARQQLDEVSLEEVARITPDDMPSVNENVVKQFTPEPALETQGDAIKNPLPPEPVDRYGRKFDSKYHARNPDGTPKINRKGLLFIARSGRGTPKKPTEKVLNIPPQVQNKAPGAEPPQPPPGVNPPPGTNTAPEVDVLPPEVARLMSPEKVGETLTELFLQATLILGGKEWEADESEKKGLQKAFTMYSQCKNLDAPSPEMALFAILTLHSAKRIPQPETQRRINSFKVWMLTMMDKIRGFFKNAGKKRQNQTFSGPQSVSGANGNGQNPPSEAPRGAGAFIFDPYANPGSLA